MSVTIKSKIGDKLKKYGCLTNGTCDMDMQVAPSTDQSGERKRRETTYISFTIELSCDNNIGMYNTVMSVLFVIFSVIDFSGNIKIRESLSPKHKDV